MINLKNRKKVILWAIGLIVLIAAVYVYRQADSLISVIKDYNIAIEEYNALSSEYNEALQNCSVDNIDGMPTEMGRLNTEEESLATAIQVILGSNTKEKIETDTQTIYSLIESIKMYNQIVQQITVPDETWVMERLEKISLIKETQSVTEDNNPDGLLNKSGGYSACTYFSIEGLDVNGVPGETIVEKGTDGGGAIEIYSSLEDAETRCDYLQGFDGTILYSGSYAVVGTMVVRISYMLSEEDQLYLTNEIVKAFTSLEDDIDGEESAKVERIEAYRYSSSFLVMKKEVSNPDEIKIICDIIDSIEYKEYDWSLVPAPIGPAPTLFKIYLDDGTVHQIKFLTYGEKGEQITIDEIEYKYEGDSSIITELWNSLSGEVEELDRNDIQ